MRRCGIAPLVTLFCLMLSTVGAQPRFQRDNPDLVKYWDPIREYLTRYGYMAPASSTGADNLRSEEQFRESIKTMQRFGGVAPSGQVDAPTLVLLNKPRCGMPDLIGNAERVRRYAIQGQQWPKKDLTWSVKYWPSSLRSDSVRAELSKAFKVWSDVSLLTFQETRSMEADIVVSFERGKHGDGYAFDGKGVVLAHAFFPGEGIGGDAHFDAEEPWVSGQPSIGVDGVRLFAVAAHEFGHSLGLSHSSVAGSLMNPFYQTIKENFQLPYDDTVGIQMLYGARSQPRWVPLSPYIPNHTPPPATRRPAYTRPPDPRRPPVVVPSNPGSQPKPEKPHTCNTTFDAISVIRGELFIFKGTYFWRLNSEGLMKNYPVEIRRFWNDSGLDVIDAVYERPIDTLIVFFSGQKFWRFKANDKLPGYPRPLTDLGLDPSVKKIDAAMVWGNNGKTYLFSGTQYWRFDENDNRVELDYPRDMSMWRGVPYNIDAAFQHTDGITYFFKGNKFWQFNDKMMKVMKNKKGNVNQVWFGCPSRSEHVPKLEEEEEIPRRRISAARRILPNVFLLLSFVVVLRTRLWTEFDSNW